MSRHSLLTVFSVLTSAVVICAQSIEGSGPPKLPVPYGHNAAAGAFVQLSGIKLYYESYGAGTPMLQLHGNGEDIASMGNQIQFFSTHYRVIAPDSRGHGKTELGPGRLTYEAMADDMNALLEHLRLKSVDVLGWSDGGIVGLLLAIHHPDKVRKLAIMGANLEPEGAYPWAVQWVSEQDKLAEQMLAQGQDTNRWRLYQQQLDLLGKQPHIALNDLHRITAPTLVMAGDKDVIRTEHTVQIFENLPNAHLCIFPGATHLIPWQKPSLYNQTIETFFTNRFRRPDTRDFFH